MGRNYFSKHGGPYFINNGLSKHTHHHEDPKHTKPDYASVFLAIGLIAIVVSFFIVNVVL